MTLRAPAGKVEVTEWRIVFGGERDFAERKGRDLVSVRSKLVRATSMVRIGSIDRAMSFSLPAARSREEVRARAMVVSG